MRFLRAMMIVLLASVGSANAVASPLDDANRSFLEADYGRAIQLYEDQAKLGFFHEDLFYNLGNAYFRDGKLGFAIYSYERALRINPQMPDVKYNLAVAREAVRDRSADRLLGAEGDPLWVRVATFFQLGDLTLAFLIGNALFFAGLTFLRFWATGFIRSAVLVLTCVMGVGAAGSGLLLNRHLYVLDNVHQGIVTADVASLREGPDLTAAERGQVHAGLRVRLLEQTATWARVSLANGVEGWIPRSLVGRL